MAEKNTDQPDDGTQPRFDPARLRARYRAERAKRIRADGNRQYQKLEGEFSDLDFDPYVEPGFSREPVADAVDAVIVGGGYGGLLVGAELRRAGLERIRIIERGGDIGGTWYWNRYPGAACDVESYIYLPLIEEVGGAPSHKYATAPEIWEHTKKIARRFDLYRDALFQTAVTEAVWDEKSETYTVRTDRDDVIRARYLITATGSLSKPKLPGIPGIASYRGHMIHSSRWDYEYTGGDQTGGLSGLADKRVAVIGTGATAVQLIPHLAEGAEHLFVFQRTPSSIHVRADRPTDPEWFEGLPKGWQKERVENFTKAFEGIPVEVDLVNDSWTQSFFDAADAAAHRDVAPHQLANYLKMEETRSRVDQVVKDPRVAEALKPWYDFFCKRPCFHDGYLEVFNRDNVTLVDTDGRGVDRIDETGLWVDGEHYEVDCIVFATGFEVGTSFRSRTGFDIRGRGGMTLDDHWKDGFRSLHGLAVHNFPNYFFINSLSQAAMTANFAHTLAEESAHIGYIIGAANRDSAKTIEVTAEAEEAWVQEIIDVVTNNTVGAQNLAFQEECTPGYYNNEGKPSLVAVQNGPYGLGATAYFGVLDSWRKAGTLPGLSLTPAPVTVEAR
ncbi:NAD(P)/FAD-dependent oxidoreductase [Microbacterium betulae]|uniref:NAD(P)/FAD-dependent oxidoreductase n=1 Tax=Microbacterium betulae TaxID=2981139 RepID=A0AA97FHN1_9MICO|nr:NAD(P)/FAD-dependent oxidoreductase [Microbacterium sp. AB]WOF22863.1 NAD(P)/FAD-dependent oxidoreductase [Microbacterium sp. AB]